MVAQRVTHLPAMWETCVRFLGWEDPLEKEMATPFGTLAWKIPWMEEPGSHSPWGHKESTRLSIIMTSLCLSSPPPYSFIHSLVGQQAYIKYMLYTVCIMPDARDMMSEKISKFFALKRVTHCHYFTAG